VDLRGPTSKGREGQGRGREGRERKGERGERRGGRRGGRGRKGRGRLRHGFWGMDTPALHSREKSTALKHFASVLHVLFYM